MAFKNNLNVELDSRLIFEADKIYGSKVVWSRTDIKAESEWIYCGLHSDFNRNMVLKAIVSLFSSDALYLSHNRDDSTKITRTDFISQLTDHLGKDFRLWDNKFENVLEFNKVGIIRFGTTAIN